MPETPDPIPPHVATLSAWWRLLIVPVARGIGVAAWHVLWFSLLIKLFWP